MTARDFFEEMKRLWGPRHVVERLMKCSKDSSGGRLESHWLEFKATLSPPKELWERFSPMDSRVERRGLPKGGSSDYVIHVMKAVCSMMNNISGGIILIGIDDNGKPAERRYLCDEIKMMPILNDDGDWDSNAWQNWAKLKLGSSLTDRFGSRWECSVAMERTTDLLHDAVEHQGGPVLVFVADSAPSAKPVQLVQTCCPGGCQTEKKSKTWCGWPHDLPPKKDWPKAVHVYKRVNGDMGAQDEWDLDELLEVWNTERRQSDSDDFRRALEKERRERKRLFVQIEDREVDLFESAEALSRRTMRLCNHFPELSVAFVQPTPHIVRVASSGDPHCRGKAVFLCKAAVVERMVSGPIPFFVDLDRFTPRDWGELKESTGAFFPAMLLKPLGCDGVYSEALVRSLLDRFGARIFLAGGTALERDEASRSLFAQSMARFLETTARSGTTLQFLLFGLPELPLPSEWLASFHDVS